MPSPYFTNVLVFGATGEVGSAVALEAHSRGARVTIAMRDTSKPNEWITPEQERSANLQRICADLTDPSSISTALHQTGAQTVFIYAVRSTDTMRSAIAALREAGTVKHVVFLSTAQVRAAGSKRDDIRSISPNHFIPWQHAQVEIGLEEAGLPHTAVRAGFFASNPLRIYLDRSSDPKQVQLLAPEVLHDPVDPADVGRVAGAVLVDPPMHIPNGLTNGSTDSTTPPDGSTSEKHVIYVTGPALLSQREQWAIINAELVAAGKPQVVVNDITVEEYLRNLAARGVPEIVAKSLAKSMSETRALYRAEDHDVESGNVEHWTGRKPSTFETFVRKEIPRYFD